MTQAGAPSNGCTSQGKNGWLVSRETMVHRTCSSSTITITRFSKATVMLRAITSSLTEAPGNF